MDGGRKFHMCLCSTTKKIITRNDERTWNTKLLQKSLNIQNN